MAQFSDVPPLSFSNGTFCDSPQHQKPLHPRKKYKLLSEVMDKAKLALTERDDYSDVSCEECGLGNRADELLLCDKCDRGFHMLCLRPVVVRVPSGSWFCPKCVNHRFVRSFPQSRITDFFRIEKFSDVFEASFLDIKRRRKRSSPLVLYKRRRILLPYTPAEESVRRRKQMASLASALVALQIEFSGCLTYMSGMAPPHANRAKFEIGGMQILSKEDLETVNHCNAMYRRGMCPPLVVVFDSCEGYTVEADGLIKDMTFIAEYTGDVDYITNRVHDDCDGMMTLLLAADSSKSLVICPDKRGNIARFVNGINNHSLAGKKKQNVKCVRYDVNAECRVFLVAIRDIIKGERLYYDYNGYEHEYPTHNFI